MNTFRDLEIHPKGRPSEFADLLASHLPDGWSRSRETEKESSRGAGVTYYCFTCENRPGVEHATMFFLEREDGAIYVCNIIPREKSQLGYAEYNAVLDDFTRSVLEQLPDRDEHLVMAFSDEIDVEVLLGEEGFRLLERFAKTSNRSTGSAHPSDREKWFDFIWHVHENDIDFGPSVFKRYIVEDAGWPAEQGWELTIEYEFALGLLQHRRP